MERQLHGAGQNHIGTTTIAGDDGQDRLADKHTTKPDNLNEATKVLVDALVEINTYYLRNINSLSLSDKNNYRNLQNTQKAEDLKSWANSYVPQFNTLDDTMAKLQEATRRTDDSLIEKAITMAKNDERLLKETNNTIENLKRKERKDDQFPFVLIHNKNGEATATNNDAFAVADFMGWKTDSINKIPVLNISQQGLKLLSQNDFPYIIINPDIDMSPYKNKPETDKENKLMMQMGLFAVWSNGNTVRYDSYGQIKGDETTVELKNGLFSITTVDKDKGVVTTPLFLFDTKDGKLTSHPSETAQENIANIQKFFNDNAERLTSVTVNYKQTRDILDQNLKDLVKQQDMIAINNPETIVLIKQHGFIEAFSDSAIKAANELQLALYNRTDHNGENSIPFTHMTVRQYERLTETNNNVYLARPKIQERLADANLTRIVGQASMIVNHNPKRATEQQTMTHAHKR